MRKKSKALLVTSHPIVDYIKIPFMVVGTSTWFSESVEPNALNANEMVDVSHIPSIKEWLRNNTIHGIDTESVGEEKRDGLDPISATSRVLLFQYGTRDKVVVVQPELITKFKSILESEEYLHVGQNIVHDFKFLLEKYGIHVVRMYDTMLVEQLLTAGLPGVRVGLEDLCRRYPPHVLLSKEVRKQFINFSGKLTREQILYAVGDVCNLFDVVDAQTKFIKKNKMELAAQDEFDCIHVTAEMELTGINVDEPILRLAISAYEVRAREIEEEAMQIYRHELKKKGKRANNLFPDFGAVFDMGSNTQKLEVMRELGFDLDDIQRSTLEAIDHKLAKLMAEYSNCIKMISTYGENLLKKRSSTSGKIHLEFNQLGGGNRKGTKNTSGTATGRYSSDGQQMPRPIERYEVERDPEEAEFFLADEIKRVKETYANKKSF